MRARYYVAVAAVLMIGVGAKLYVYPPQKAEAEPIRAGLNIHQMHLDRPMSALPREKMSDKAFIYADDD